MKKRIKTSIEKWAVNLLYWHGFNTSGRINKKKKKIIFYFAHYSIFKNFHSPKEALAVSILINYFGYTIWEQTLSNLWCVPYKAPISHTWGEIQDIIRSYRFNLPKPISPNFN